MLAKDTHTGARELTHMGNNYNHQEKLNPIQFNRDWLPPRLVTLATCHMATGEPREL
jgi:hypothetical protein